MHKANRIHISHIRIGFADVVSDQNYTDSHRPLYPFGMKWGRGLLIRGKIRGKGYFEAVTESYHTSHSRLKQDLGDDETSDGTFYFGYEAATKTLYLEYASDRMFDFYNQEVIDAIMNSLKQSGEPFRDFILEDEQIMSAAALKAVDLKP